MIGMFCNKPLLIELIRTGFVDEIDICKNLGGSICIPVSKPQVIMLLIVVVETGVTSNTK